MSNNEFDNFEKEKELARQAELGKKDRLKEILSKPLSYTRQKIKEFATELDLRIHDKQEEVFTPYQSRDGFVKTSVLRGFTEISFLFNLIKEKNLNCFICGGYVRYMCSESQNPIKAGDCDVYSYDTETFESLKKILTEEFDLKIKHENDVSITFVKPKEVTNKFFSAPIIQIIKPVDEGAIKVNGSMENILSNFDFTVVRCGLLSEKEAMVDSDFSHDEPKAILRIKNIHCPVSSTLRCMKYSTKGYWLPPMQALRLFINWDSRDDEYKAKLVGFLAETEKRGLTKEEINELEAMLRID